MKRREHDVTAARGLGVISSIGPRAKGFIFASDAQQTEYFIHCEACRPRPLFDELLMGDKVSFSVADTPKGLRGHDVRRMTESEQEAFRLQQRDHATAIAERRGNAQEHGQRQSFVEDHDDAFAPPPYRRRK